jgi:hypothetical protein
MRFLKGVNAPLPAELKTAADYVLNADLRREFEVTETDVARVRRLFEEARAGSVELRVDGLAYSIKANLDRRMETLAAQPDDGAFLARTSEVAGVVPEMGLEVNFWKTQNIYFRLLHDVVPRFRARAEAGDAAAAEWLTHFLKLGECLGFQMNGGGP